MNVLSLKLKKVEHQWLVVVIANTVRTKNGGWFSINIQSSWQSGRLDVDNKAWNQLLEDYNDMPKVREALINQKYS